MFKSQLARLVTLCSALAFSTTATWAGGGGPDTGNPVWPTPCASQPNQCGPGGLAACKRCCSTQCKTRSAINQCNDCCNRQYSSTMQNCGF